MIDVHSQIKRIRTKIGYYPAIEVIDESIRYLRHVDFGRPDDLAKFQPWYLFRLIKMAFLYGSLIETKKLLTNKAFFEVFGMVQQLGNNVKMPNEYENLFLFFRNMAYQQFWFQENISFDQIARQEMIFGEFLKSTHIQKISESTFGFNYKEVTLLILSILTRFMDSRTSIISFDWFDKVPIFSQKTSLNLFFGTLSKDFWGFRDYFLNENSKFKNPGLEYYEETPLLNYPFLKTPEGFAPFSVKLLYSTFTTLLYDKLKEKIPQFMDYFGPAFEAYVGNSLAHLPYQTYNENEHKKHFSIGSKAVDFSFQVDESLFLVDAKGGEISHLGMVAHSNSIVSDKVKDIILKGIRQALQTAIEFKKKGYFNKKKPKFFFLMLVTYKNILISNGDYFFKHLNNQAMSELEKDFGAPLPIPLENMVFVSVRELDLLVSLVQKGFNLQDVFLRFVDAQKEPTQRKFLFSQYLFELNSELDSPNFLKAKIDEIKNRIKNIVSNKKA